MIQATGKFDVPDYSAQRPHGMIGIRPVWALERGESLWVPNDSEWGFNAEHRPPEGSEFEVAWVRPGRWIHGEGWEVVAFGATMLRLQGLDAMDYLQVVLPHVPAICPTCREMFSAARRSAGLETEEN